MSIRLAKPIVESIDSFTGRTWLLPKILTWWERTDDRVLLLTGAPGTGKSMILAWLAGFGPSPPDPIAQAQLVRVRSLITAAHFCEASSRNITPQAFAENVANQLTANVKGFADALAMTLADRVQISATQTTGTIAAGGSATNLSIGHIDEIGRAHV